MSSVDIELRDTIAGLLEENRRKAPRVQANVIAQLLADRRAPAEVKSIVHAAEPVRWAKYAERNAALLEQGVATTRNRTDAAIQALGLVPSEVRAVVIEPNVVHVFRWTDASERVGIGLPIIEEKTA